MQLLCHVFGHRFFKLGWWPSSEASYVLLCSRCATLRMGGPLASFPED